MLNNLLLAKYFLVIMSSVVLLNACDKIDFTSTKNQFTRAPGNSKNVLASFLDNKSLVSWDIPITSNSSKAVKYYRLENSLLNKNNFSKIVAQLPASQLSFTDLIISRKCGDSFECRIIAGNSTGSSSSGLSFPVILGSSLDISHIAPNYLTSSYAKEKDNFGFNIAFGADRTMASAVAMKGRSFINGQKPSAVNSKPSLLRSVMVFSPDSNSLAVAETGTDIVRVYNTVNTSGWDTESSKIQNVFASTKLEILSDSIAFNPNDKTLVIREQTITVYGLLDVGTV